MGGIAGILRFDGQPVPEADKEHLIDLLTHRGKTTSQQLDAGWLLSFGGELEIEPPSALYAALDADLFSATRPSFLTNFTQTGPIGFNELNADFAVAIWDAQRQTLVCGRDPLGVKPLYYVHQPGRFVAFASEIKALLALSDVAVKPNEHKFREYLTWATSYVPYSAETFYESIYSVLPGHCVEISPEGIQVMPYWKTDYQSHGKLSQPADYAAAFQDSFTAAINARIRGKKRVGSHLSGGLDSSSVSAVAQSLLAQQQRPALHTFTINTGLDSTDESVYVQAFVDRWHSQHHTVSPEVNVLESVLTINRLFDRPDHFIIPSSFHLGVSQEARQLDCDILLTGHDGDSVIATGFDFLDELLDAKDWDALQLACHQYTDHRFPPDYTANPPRLRNDAQFEAYALSILGTNLKKRLREQAVGDFVIHLQRQKRDFGLSTTGILTYLARRVKEKLLHRSRIDHAFLPEFRQRVERRPVLSTEPLATALSEGRPVPVKQILNTTNVICNEQMNHIGAYYGHPYSFPFFDKRVVELGLSTPLEVCFDQGRGRGLIRNGLKTVLPAAITGRYSKANFVEYGNLSARQLYSASYEQFSTPVHPIWGVIDRQVFEKIVKIVFNPKIPVQRKTRYNWLLSRIIYLALWLGSLPKGG
ncbi:asparagine synthetase B family protein [Spirosoma aerophilum]